ncbi:hypothetical protein QQS21_008280 [Conoideocrella luteorostrata]|uniref:Sorbitol dehydrogenase n=1 Tax=Conoideocrella luteorostrata TaxID=1105319 RepID=A0AAJ0CLI3_9HYPO|nr:hypothetical protein QQS21_008280 [Conoideocrella luteorostrata]
MSSPNLSAGQYLYAAKDLRFETREIPTPGPGEVVVAVRSTTLCGSDLHYYNHYKNGSILVREPLCLGHESSGEIVAAGEKASLKVGDRVALEVGVPCRECDLCKAGRYNICPHLRFRSSGSKFPHYQGTLQEYVCHPESWVHPLPESLDFEVGALLEPLAVAVQAVRRIAMISSPQPVENVLIFGAGAIGLLTALALRATGVKNIAMADIHLGRLKFARENAFASIIYEVKPKSAASVDDAMSVAKDVAQDMGELQWPHDKTINKFNVVFECTGVASCIQTSIYATKSGGYVVVAGLGTPNITIPISEASAREITIVPTWRYANAYPEAMRVAEASVKSFALGAEQKLPDIRKLITHRFEGLDSVPDAFALAGASGDSKGGVVIKTVVNCA